MPPTADIILAMPPTRAASRAIVVCVQSATTGRQESDCRDLIAALLRHDDVEIVLHGGPRIARVRDEIGRDRAVSEGDLCRITVSDAPLGSLLSGADVVVSFTAPALIDAGKNGLKPVQIGTAMAGSEAFSNIFPNVAAFAHALSGGAVRGRLSLPEYDAFEKFCAELQRRRGPRSRRDPMVRACRRYGPARSSPIGTIIGAIGNPFAAWRLLLGSRRSPRSG